MRNFKWISVIVFGICATTLPVLSSTGGRQKAEPNHPTLIELIDKYTQALDPIQSFIGSSEFTNVRSSVIPSWGSNLKNATSYGRVEYRTDGKGRTSLRDYRWGTVSANLPEISESAPDYSRRVIGNDFTYNHNKLLRTTTSKGSLIYLTKGTKDFEGTRRGGSYITNHGIPSYFLGYFDTKARLDGVLKNAKRISVRQEPEMINGSPCYVVQADTKYGDYTLWLDSEHGFQPVRIEASRGGDDIIGVKLPPPDKRVEGKDSFVIENVKFEEVEGIWIPVEGRLRKHIEWPQDGFFFDYDTHFKTTEIILNPDHDALGSFANPMKNPELDPELVNGTMVRVGRERLDCVWRDGRIFDSYGHEVDIATLKPLSVDPERLEPASLVGEHLPNLGQFSIRLELKWTENKKILVCFWDMSQRPSRNCIQTLNKRAQTLLKRNVYIVFVHTDQEKRMELTAWVKENRITPPVGVSRSKLSGLRQSWGVQSLPWLILTNNDHIVTAEGFSITELDEKIKEAK